MQDAKAKQVSHLHLPHPLLGPSLQYTPRGPLPHLPPPAHTEAPEAGWGLCCSPALTMRAHSLAGTLATWAEQVMAEECRGARYGAGTAGQPGVCRSSTTSSSSSSNAPGAWWAAVCGVAESLTRLKRLSSSSRISKRYFCHVFFQIQLGF